MQNNKQGFSENIEKLRWSLDQDVCVCARDV